MYLIGGMLCHHYARLNIGTSAFCANSIKGFAMSVFDGLNPSLLDYVADAQQLKQDQLLLEQYSKQISGIGLEVLNESPAHRLVEQGLVERYGAHYKVGSGNEGLILLAAVVAGGYAVYKKMMRAKNNPVLKDIIGAEKKVENTYTPAWLNGKESVGREVENGMISKLFDGKDFATVSKELEKYFTETVNAFKKATADHIKLWEEIEPYIYRWGDATDPEVREGIVEELRAKYGRDVWTESCADIDLKKEDKKAVKLPALTKDEYSKAVELIKSLIAKAIDVDELSEDVWHHVGLWAYFDKFDDDNGIWEWGYAEIVNGDYGQCGYRLHTQLIGIARGLEEWITKSFK